MHLPLLCASTRMKQAFPERPFVAYRRPKNLRDLLVHANLKPSHLEPARGSSPCESKRCLTCQHIRSGTSVQSTVSGRTFRVHATANCKTSNVVYLIECSLCHVQYVGETRNALHIRMNGHRGDIYHRRLDKPVSAHFNSSDHNLQHLSIMVLEVMRSQNEDIRKMREFLDISLTIPTSRRLKSRSLILVVHFIPFLTFPSLPIFIIYFLFLFTFYYYFCTFLLLYCS